eukprot:TRINITY_DN576_c0_g1_i7.p2 TRINITY_DN576_c0_g1~~TRINITY_DN576_c0_g1_i7.p2  ORF type:complete len:147 (+),score=26.55 TRINITY_DN576_c0_g1_i7:427-867(+)
MGYGSRALDLLSQYFEGELSAVDDTPRALERPRAPPPSDGSTLLTEKIAPRQHLPPLLQDLSSRPPEHLHYIGSSFGVTLPLFRFWSRAGYHPLYAGQTAALVYTDEQIYARANKLLSIKSNPSPTAKWRRRGRKRTRAQRSRRRR